jgi:hypothetical protein
MDAVDIKDDSAEYGDMFYWDVDSSTVQAALNKYTRGGLRNVSASSQEISAPCKKKNHLPESPSLPAAHSNNEHIAVTTEYTIYRPSCNLLTIL